MAIETLLLIWIAVAVVLFPIELFVKAPYGRHTTSAFGLLIPNKAGWILMEGWALLVFGIIYGLNFNANTFALLFAALYVLHYINRALIFPLRTRTDGKKMPLAIALSAMAFNSVNASTIAWYLSQATYDANYFSQWNFILGLVLFVTGFFINNKADTMLINLRKPGETGYKIPKGFLFDYISCPNLFGEMVEWLGFAFMVWNLAGVSFLVWTVSNLLPRALHHHKWYLEKFADYPKERKAVFPFIV